MKKQDRKKLTVLDQFAKLMIILLIIHGSILLIKDCQAVEGEGWICHQRLVQRGNARIGVHECNLRVFVNGEMREYTIPDNVKRNIAHTYNNTHTET